jgi:hypothetical protein
VKRPGGQTPADHRARQITSAADIAISIRPFPDGSVTAADVRAVAADHFGVTITDAEAGDVLRARLAYRGWNADGTGLPGEPPAGPEDTCRACGHPGEGATGRPLVPFEGMPVHRDHITDPRSGLYGASDIPTGPSTATRGEDR